MDKYDIRRENLQALIDREFGPRAWGAKAKFAKRLEKQPDYISRCLYPPGKPGAKNVGEDLAREIERKFNLPMYSFDSPNLGDHERIEVDGLPAPLAQKINSYRPVISVERYDVSASMGSGAEPPEMNMIIEHMSLDAAWVRQNLSYTSTDNLKLISGRGDSMAPTIRNGDALLVDSGVNSVEADAIYFFQMNGRQHVKRIQRNLDGLTIISDNTQYRELNVPADREQDIHILAQIIYWWTGRSF